MTHSAGLRGFLPQAGPLLAGILAALAVGLGLALLPAGARETLRERALDLALGAAIPPAQANVAVVDIDEAALASLGPWPWPRTRMAALVAAALGSGAAAVAVDVLFDGPDAKSPATLAAALAAALERPDLAAWARTLQDGDATLAATIEGRPVALGFALASAEGEKVPGVPILLQGREPAFSGLWQVAGAVLPEARLALAADGLGALPLPGDAEGVVRRTPLFVAVNGEVRPGLALEAVRLARGATAYRLDGAAGTFGLGDAQVRLPRDGMLRLIPAAETRTVPALGLLAGPVASLRDAVVFIGGSAPELGGLRAAAGDALTPSVMLHAAAARQLLGGVVPVALRFGWLAPPLAVAASLLAALRLRPVAGGVAVAGILAVLWAGAVLAGRAGLLFDAGPASALAVAAFAASALAAAARTQWREARIRQRFAQHLAPDVVALIAADPGMLKLRGQQREITALFTDIEGFTALTRRAGPEALVALLDGYFEGVAEIVIRHGGMIDKLVGDAVHAFFNMPLDLPGHPLAAVRCAMEIVAWTEGHRQAGAALALGLGRTRIGVETGPAVVGDVGLRAKLDYTAHGDTVNAAARFEAANKELGSAICVGPGTASRCPDGLLRPTGRLALRGFTQEVTTYAPWPDWADTKWRAAYLAAWESGETAAFAALAGDDPVAAALAHD